MSFDASLALVCVGMGTYWNLRDLLWRKPDTAVWTLDLLASGAMAVIALLSIARVGP